MTKTRLEAFSDGVIAIIITIMVLELKVPHCATLADLRPLIPVALIWVSPDARIESQVHRSHPHPVTE